MVTTSKNIHTRREEDGDSGRQSMLPLNWDEVADAEHFVQFYENDGFLVDSLSGFVRAGLNAGEACIVLATQPHRKELEDHLQADGLDLVAAQAQDAYIAQDAVEALAKIMVDGSPDPGLFATVIVNLIERARHGQRRVRVFGELVALLWNEGNRAAAVRLEELWNDLCHNGHSFSLFCAYPMHDFDGETYRAQFTEICKQHSWVIPDESYTALADPDERLRAITLLQQRARSLEAEIAERKAAEERLRVSENRYRRLFEASRDGILIVDPLTGLITDANPSMAELSGCSQEQLPGRELWQIGLFKDREAHQEFLQALQKVGTIRFETLALQTADGQCRYVDFLSTLFRANGHDIIQCNMRDITDRKRAEDEQRLLEERKNAFISMASHELKTPLTSLKGFLHLVQRHLNPQVDPQIQHFLDRMDTQLQRLTHLVGDLLDVSRMQTGTLAFRKSEVDVDELVREVVDDMQSITTTHRLLLQGETRARLHADRDRLGQVLINLLTNAIKYSPHADSVVVRLNRDDEQIELAVQDFGIGIDPEHHERIFERFYQITDAQGPTYPGLGIGLYITHTIVERHGGRIWLESKKGEGSTFHVILPLLCLE
jgi:PAS domain S-box-containing protein